MYLKNRYLRFIRAWKTELSVVDADIFNYNKHYFFQFSTYLKTIFDFRLSVLLFGHPLTVVHNLILRCVIVYSLSKIKCLSFILFIVGHKTKMLHFDL